MENMETNKSVGSPKYWQSLEQWRNDPQFQSLLNTEFQSSPLREESQNEGGWARREFLKLMGASIALGSFGCVRRPAQMIVPYVKRPKDVIEGIANYYASTYADGSEVFGVIVTTREGRPISLTGNPDHPINRGGMSARALAHVLSLYDPARLTGPVRNLLNKTRTNRDTVSTTLEKADEEIAAQLKKGKVALLTGSVFSPSLFQVINEFCSATGAMHYKWEPLSHENYVRGQEMSYGTDVAPRLVLEKAKHIVSIQSDILGTFLNATEQTKGFSKGRSLEGGMNRLVVFESLLTLTGTNSDERYRIRPSDSVWVAMGLLHELLINKKVSSYAGDASITNVVRGYEGADARLELPAGTLAKLANDLWAARGESLVVAGEDLATQVATNLLNSVLGNDGVTVDHSRSPHVGYQGSTKSLMGLKKAIESGAVKSVIIHGVNPGYAVSDFAEVLRKAEMVVYTGDRVDETGRLSEYVIPDHHPMEAWGDVEGQKGIYSIQQPTIEPLYNTRSFGDSLIAWAKAGGFGGPSKHESMHDVVKATWTSRLGVDWVEGLQTGVVDKVGGSRNASGSGRSFRSSALQVASLKNTPKSDFELCLYPTIGLGDGKMANVPWLQEFPDPVTKIVWDNYITISPAAAEKMHVREGQVLSVTVGDKTVSAPAHIQPGQSDSALGLALGYGRTGVGDIGNNIGVNAYPLAVVGEESTKYFALNASVKALATLSPLACTQGHHAMSGKTPEGIDMGHRQIVVEATFEDWKKNPEANIERHAVFSAWSGHKYPGHKWGMSIDLNLCTGCSACVIACQSENNIPVVGKKYVLQGREMHWMRIDRYYVGDPTAPDTVHMPLLCQHCDNAPCETVCPVAATVHSSEGTNDMIYNRCVGTRYCSNNCPYKVRRFNWFNYSRMEPNLYAKPMHMQLNPEVSVRVRGVMEKCTFCTHKIQQAKTRAKLEDRNIKDGDVVTACQAACPTNAIVFGDVNDPDSKVSKALKDVRHYELLEDLNNRPAVRYASKIRNSAKLKGPAAGHEGGEGHEGQPQHESHQEKGGHA